MDFMCYKYDIWIAYANVNESRNKVPHYIVINILLFLKSNSTYNMVFNDQFNNINMKVDVINTENSNLQKYAKYLRPFTLLTDSIYYYWFYYCYWNVKSLIVSVAVSLAL